MSERFKVQSWKGCVGAIPPWVRIPSSLIFCIFIRHTGLRAGVYSIQSIRHDSGVNNNCRRGKFQRRVLSERSEFTRLGAEPCRLLVNEACWLVLRHFCHQKCQNVFMPPAGLAQTVVASCLLAINETSDSDFSESCALCSQAALSAKRRILRTEQQVESFFAVLSCRYKKVPFNKH